MTPSELAKLPKEQIAAMLEAAYADAKPKNDAMVDVSLRIQTLTAEVYRRGISKQLPGVPITTVRLLMTIGCNVHPNKGLPKLAQKIAELKSGGATITSIEFDETLSEYRFYGEKPTTEEAP